MRKAAAISLRIEPEIKNRLESLARATHRSKSFLVEDALEACLGVNEWQIRGIMEAVQEARQPWRRMDLSRGFKGRMGG